LRRFHLINISDVNPEVTGDDNYNDHYANDVKDTHFLDLSEAAITDASVVIQSGVGEPSGGKARFDPQNAVRTEREISDSDASDRCLGPSDRHRDANDRRHGGGGGRPPSWTSRTGTARYSGRAFGCNTATALDRLP
jgi:hypothetical protein